MVTLMVTDGDDVDLPLTCKDSLGKKDKERIRVSLEKHMDEQLKKALHVAKVR